MSEEKGIWASEAWKTPELSVVVHTGKEKKEEHINRSLVRDATIFDVVTQHLGLMKGTKTIVVEVDGKVMKPLEAKKVAASTVMEISIYPSDMKREAVVPAKPLKKATIDDRKYHQHRGIQSSHKITDKHKDEAAQRYHVDEMKYTEAYAGA